MNQDLTGVTAKSLSLELGIRGTRRVEGRVKDQTSADKDSESPDSSVSFLSGWTDRQRVAFFYNPDRIRTADRHRTRFSVKSEHKRDKDRTWPALSADVWFLPSI